MNLLNFSYFKLDIYRFRTSYKRKVYGSNFKTAEILG